MKKIAKYICLAMALGLFTQCSDYLNTENPGQSDDAFVMSSPTEALKTLTWAYAQYRQDCAHGGNYLYQDVLGSDAEYMSEYPTANNVIARCQPTATAIGSSATQYNSLNIVLARAARIADAIAAKGEYKTDVAGGKATDWTHLYGEARALRAFCAWELVRHYGDVPYGYENKVVDSYELTSRFVIMDNIIDDLKAVEGLMYKLDDKKITAERISRNFVNALIGEIALHAGGWQTIRTDMKGLYGDVQFDTKGSDDNMCVYARRKDYLEYIKVAEQYLDIAVNKLGAIPALYTTDTRSTTNNPFQLHWQKINSRLVSNESFFEIGCVTGVGNCEHPYSMGRAGANNAAVSLLNTFAAIRMIPTFFYNAYEKGDKRRDASMVVTGSDAASGREVLIPMGVGTRTGGGGPCINKWDQNRGDVPNLTGASNRASGMNYTVMRMADAMLMLAEAKAINGDNAGAVTLVNTVRARAFGDNNHAISNLSGEALLDAIYAERKLELLGEGDIRWDMIRSGKFNERAIAVRQEMVDMANGLQANGYYTFPSGRTISNYVWTKFVQLNGSAAVVTQDCTDESNPALFPGWRGIYNWGAAAHTATAKNLAIKGLYEYIDPNGAEAAALVADGYTRADWGIKIWNDANAKAMLDGAILNGVVGRESKAPRYFHPLPITVLDQSKGKVTNGYELPQK